MRLRTVLVVAGLLGAVAATGCKKKEPATAQEYGTTEGMEADRMRTERVQEPATPVTPPLGESDVSSSELARALKDIYFDFDRYEVRTDQRPRLEENARWLMSHPSTSVIIEGHCDERGTEEYNLALGQQRANAARTYLVALGVPGDRLTTISYGEAYPADPRHNEEAWALNRRAHFTLPPSVGQAPAMR